LVLTSTSKYIPAHEISASIGRERATALPVFYAYTGCDIVSSCATRGKKLAWQTWNAFDDVAATFCTPSDAPGDIDDEAMAMLELFTVLLYERTTDMDNIDEVCQHLFTKRGLTMECLSTNKSCTREQCIRLATSGGQHLRPLLPFHLQEIGLDRSATMETIVDCPS